MLLAFEKMPYACTGGLIEAAGGSIIVRASSWREGVTSELTRLVLPPCWLTGQPPAAGGGFSRLGRVLASFRLKDWSAWYLGLQEQTGEWPSLCLFPRSDRA